MYRRFHILMLLLVNLSVFSVYSQQTTLKTNVLFWGTTTPNAGVEVGIAKQITIDIWGAYNAWKFSNNMKLNLYLAQPEIRYWFCRKFEGHFVGIHGHYGHFNIGQIPFIPSLENHVFRGDLYGGGISYGYHWSIGKRWGIEATIGAGYAYMDYTKYRCVECAESVGSYTRSYIGPTRVGFSVMYFLR